MWTRLPIITAIPIRGYVIAHKGTQNRMHRVYALNAKMCPHLSTCRLSKVILFGNQLAQRLQTDALEHANGVVLRACADEAPLHQVADELLLRSRRFAFLLAPLAPG